MVGMRDGVPEPIKKLGAKLKSVFLPFVEDEKQAEAARRRFEKAVFRSQYSVDEFEQSLDNHRHKMRELGEAISKCVKEVRKNWQKAQKLGPHEAKAYKAIAKTYFKRVIALEERIDAHLQKFEQKLHVLTAWRQYKIQNDIGSDVDVTEVQEFIGNEFDQFDISDNTLEAEEGEIIGTTIRGQNDGSVISEDEEEMLNDWVESEMDETDTDHSSQEVDKDAEELFEQMGIDDPAAKGSDHDAGNGISGTGESTGNSEIDDDLKAFVGDEFN